MKNKRVLQIVQEDINQDGKQDLTIGSPEGPIVTLYGWKGILGYFLGLTLSIALAGLGVGTVFL